MYRSEYFFDADGKIAKCNAISPLQKTKFVEERVDAYDISIGIGDHPEFDGPFIQRCTIPLLTTPHDQYISVPTFGTARVLIEKIIAIGESIPSHDLRKLTPAELFSRLTIGSWGLVLTLVGVSLGVGGAMARAF